MVGQDKNYFIFSKDLIRLVSHKKRPRRAFSVCIIIVCYATLLNIVAGTLYRIGYPLLPVTVTSMYFCLILSTVPVYTEPLRDVNCTESPATN
jgi:hypothetical protein